jgi:c-di-GMP-binding flagellar brake protein YcgR
VFRKYSGRDRRRFQRLDLNITVFYRVHEPLVVRLLIGDREVEATILNISEGGIALLTEYDIAVDTILFIKFNLSTMAEDGSISLYGPLQITGEVCSNVFLDNRHRLGIRFTEIQDKDKACIADFVKKAFAQKIY